MDVLFVAIVAQVAAQLFTMNTFHSQFQTLLTTVSMARAVAGRVLAIPFLSDQLIRILDRACKQAVKLCHLARVEISKHFCVMRDVHYSGEAEISPCSVLEKGGLDRVAAVVESFELTILVTRCQNYTYVRHDKLVGRQTCQRIRHVCQRGQLRLHWCSVRTRRHGFVHNEKHHLRHHAVVAAEPFAPKCTDCDIHVAVGGNLALRDVAKKDLEFFHAVGETERIDETNRAGGIVEHIDGFGLVAGHATLADFWVVWPSIAVVPIADQR
jgi:hypothetical protein